MTEIAEPFTAPSPSTTNWVPLGSGSGVPQPVVNGQWVKGVGGAAVWSAIAQADLAGSPIAIAPPAPPGNDLNQIVASGWYLNSGMANAPNASWLWVEARYVNANYQTQTARDMQADNPREWIRQNNTGVWSPWVLRAPTLSYGTSLPASPYDGQEAILVDSTTNPSYQWRFRYNAGSTSAYKWEFVGGAETIARSATNVSTTSTTSVDLGGISITLPRDGDYNARFSLVTYLNVASGNTFANLFVNAFDSGIDTSVVFTTAFTQVGDGTSGRLSGVSGGRVITLRHSVTAGTGNWPIRALAVVPVRVS